MAKQEGSAYTEIVLAIDNGNSHIKAIYDQLEQSFVMPNLISKPFGKQDTLLKLAGDPLDFLELQLSSPALDSKSFSHVYVGKRAMADSGVTHEIVGDTAKVSKAERPETIVTILSSAAYAVAKKNESQIVGGIQKIRAKVYLGIGLPVGEYADKHEEFAKRLTGVHTVTFGQTPIFKDVTIELDIVLPDGVAIDDVSAAIDIDTSSKRNLSGKNFGIADLGGVDADIVFFHEGLELDLLKPYAAKINLNNALDAIRKEVNINKEYIQTTAELVDRITRQNYTLSDRGKPIDIRPIVKSHLEGVAERAFKILLDAWGTVNYADEFWLVGGGSIILKPYIENLNVDDYPIFFDDSNLSQLRNVRGTFTQLYVAVTSDKEAAATNEK